MRDNNYFIACTLKIEAVFLSECSVTTYNKVEGHTVTPPVAYLSCSAVRFVMWCHAMFIAVYIWRNVHKVLGAGCFDSKLQLK